MRRVIIIGCVAAALMAAPAHADEKSLGEQVDEALMRALQSLETFVDRFPGYEAPEVTPEGDIIIRKRRKAAEEPPPPGQRRI